MELFFISFRLLEIIQLQPQCKEFMLEIQKYSHLDTITEGTLWDFYGECLETAGTEPFTDFSQSNKDTYHRLKMRAMEDRLKNLTTLLGSNK